MAAALSSNIFSHFKANPEEAANKSGIVVQVVKLDPPAPPAKQKCTLVDGSGVELRCTLASQLTAEVAQGNIKTGAVLNILNCQCNMAGSLPILFVTEAEVMDAGSDSAGDAKALASLNMSPAPATAGTPLPVKAEAGAQGGVGPQGRGATAPGTGRALKENATPGPLPSPSEEFRYKFAKTPGGATPGGMASLAGRGMPMRSPPMPSPTQGGPGQKPAGALDRKTYHKIEQLNPYSDSWCVKARVDRKYPLRSASTKAGARSVQGLELVDDAGGVISATAWGELAERADAELQEGRVYVFNKFKVSPADKKYSSVKCDYKIDFTNATDFAECADQDTSTMTAALDIVSIASLPRHVGRKAPVDVCGIVTTLSAQGTVKRKADNTELEKRDVTLVDSSGRSVVVSLWGEHAMQASGLEGREGDAVLQLAGVRVSEYNGCSLNTTRRTVITIDPPGAAAQDLGEWYRKAVAAGEHFAPVAEAAQSRGGGGGAGGDRGVGWLKDVKAVTPDMVPDANRGMWHNANATVVKIMADKDIYYLAHPDNGKKVVDQGGGQLWCEAEQRFVEHAEQRYLFRAVVADHTGSEIINIFNAQGVTMMGRPADALAAAKAEGDDKLFNELLKAGQWGTWAMGIVSRPNEYQGTTRMRHMLQKCGAVDWMAEGRTMLDLIGRY